MTLQLRLVKFTTIVFLIPYFLNEVSEYDPDKCTQSQGAYHLNEQSETKKIRIVRIKMCFVPFRLNVSSETKGRSFRLRFL